MKLVLLLAAVLSAAAHAQTRTYSTPEPDTGIKITGSSTAAPTIAMASEGLEGITVNPNGTMRGFEELCTDPNVQIIGASQRISEAQFGLCQVNGVPRLAEFLIGVNGIVLAQAQSNRQMDVGLPDIFLAVGSFIPEDDDTCVLVPNPNASWKDIRRDLPNRPIRVYGPPVTSATRARFIDLAIAEGARQIDCLAELERRDPKAFERAILPRHDEVWVDAGENDAAIAEALRYTRDAVGILGWQSYDAANGLDALLLGGIAPSATSIAAGRYPLSGPVFLYVEPEALTDPRARRLVQKLAGPDESRPVRRVTTSTPTEVVPGLEVSAGRLKVYGTWE